MIDFTELLKKNNVQLVVTVEDLREFAYTIISAYQEELDRKLKQEQEEEGYLSPNDVCNMLGVSKSTLWRWSRTEYLVVHKLGSKSYYKKSDIKKLMSRDLSR